MPARSLPSTDRMLIRSNDLPLNGATRRPIQPNAARYLPGELRVLGSETPKVHRSQKQIEKLDDQLYGLYIGIAREEGIDDPSNRAATPARIRRCRARRQRNTPLR